jgi:hypothetical protein
MESQGDADTGVDELVQMLSLSAAFDDDLMALLEKSWNNSSQRFVICMAFCKAAVEHAISQRVQIESGLHGTALSLIRLQFETVVRAAWVLHGATLINGSSSFHHQCQTAISTNPRWARPFPPCSKQSKFMPQKLRWS